MLYKICRNHIFCTLKWMLKIQLYTNFILLTIFSSVFLKLIESVIVITRLTVFCEHFWYYSPTFLGILEITPPTFVEVSEITFIASWKHYFLAYFKLFSIQCRFNRMKYGLRQKSDGNGYFYLNTYIFVIKTSKMTSILLLFRQQLKMFSTVICWIAKVAQHFFFFENDGLVYLYRYVSSAHSWNSENGG